MPSAGTLVEVCRLLGNVLESPLRGQVPLPGDEGKRCPKGRVGHGQGQGPSQRSHHEPRRTNSQPAVQEPDGTHFPAARPSPTRGKLFIKKERRWEILSGCGLGESESPPLTLQQTVLFLRHSFVPYLINGCALGVYTAR